MPPSNSLREGGCTPGGTEVLVYVNDTENRVCCTDLCRETTDEG